MAEVGEQSIGDVGHRLGAGLGSGPTLPVGRSWRWVTAAQILEFVTCHTDVVAQQRQSRS